MPMTDADLAAIEARAASLHRQYKPFNEDSRLHGLLESDIPDLVAEIDRLRNEARRLRELARAVVEQEVEYTLDDYARCRRCQSLLSDQPMRRVSGHGGGDDLLSDHREPERLIYRHKRHSAACRVGALAAALDGEGQDG